MSNSLKISEKKLISISALAKEIRLIDKKGNPLTHVIRFWESKFSYLKPIKFSSNRRFYSKKKDKELGKYKPKLQEERR